MNKIVKCNDCGSSNIEFQCNDGQYYCLDCEARVFLTEDDKKMIFLTIGLGRVLSVDTAFKMEKGMNSTAVEYIDDIIKELIKVKHYLQLRGDTDDKF